MSAAEFNNGAWVWNEKNVHKHLFLNNIPFTAYFLDLPDNHNMLPDVKKKNTLL